MAHWNINPACNSYAGLLEKDSDLACHVSTSNDLGITLALLKRLVEVATKEWLAVLRESSQKK